MTKSEVKRATKELNRPGGYFNPRGKVKKAAEPVSWRPEVLVKGEWVPNGQRFATRDEAKEAASEVFSRWLIAESSRAEPSSDPVNYRWEIPAGSAVSLAEDVEFALAETETEVKDMR